MKKWLISISVVAALATGVTQAGAAVVGNAEAGQMKAAACAGCHGLDGNSPSPVWPALAGQHAEYLSKQLMDFKNGKRKDPLMTSQAALLATPQDVANVAAYFASQELTVGRAKPEAVTLGAQVFRGGNLATGTPACSGCHGPVGMGNPLANFPRIAGQHAAYTTKALKDFRAATRSNDVNGRMRGAAAHMSDAEIEAVAQFLQGLSD
jgi:cytochrome c553